jgi:hypothetical protein
MKVEDLIYKHFKDEDTKWFDHIDYIKSNFNLQRKGLKQVKRFGRFEIYVVSEDGEEILFDTLQNDDISKFENILKAFWQ